MALTLSDVSINKRGYYGIGASAVPFSNDLYAYLRISDIKDDGTINSEGLMSVSDSKAKDYLLHTNDIVFARTGANTGRNYFYDERDGDFVYAGFLIKFSLDSQKVNPKFIKYYCQTKGYKEWINSFKTGSTRGNINERTLAQMPIPDLPRDQQDSIVDILASLDEKIRINKAINQNLEQQTQALFKEWFIDFEPFGGIAPEEWKFVTLKDVAYINTNTFSPIKNPDVMVEYYSIPAYDENRYPVFELASCIKSNKYILSPVSVMISKLNPDIKRIWRPMCISDAPICSTEFIVYEAYNPDYRDFVYSVIDSTPFFQFMCAHTTGSTNSRQRTTPKATLDFPLLLPPDTVIKQFCNIVSPMYDLIASNIKENQSLSHTLDGLLPKLMSNELDVSSLNI